ncbi:hypothetical protein BN946_scf184884.g25 [Trametes cinnabarina]|uniref:guanosine-diphosphatase n=1 Tax=Pycnoporus cinnabarinus TaxID=5643 RepID=A0A060S6P9_PYCCI|nr:hypothetical protein BN946_scf184884.g25 [Trametes cinnabarina]
MLSQKPEETQNPAVAAAEPPLSDTLQALMDVVQAHGPDFSEYLTSPMEDSPFEEFLTTPALGSASVGADLLTSPAIFDADSFPDFGDVPLFESNGLGLSGYETLKASAAPAPLPPQPSFNFDDMYTMPSPTTPSLDPASLHPSPRTGAMPTPSTPGTRIRKTQPTGTRKNITPDALVPLDAPIQPRKYVVPSATSRKEVPTAFLKKKRARSQAFGEEDELVADENTLAARRSRKRKLEYQRELELSVEREKEEKEMWKRRAAVLQALLESHGHEHGDCRKRLREMRHRSFIFSPNDHLPHPAPSSDSTFVFSSSAKLAENKLSHLSSFTDHTNDAAIFSSTNNIATGTTVTGNSHSRRRSRGSRSIVGDMFSPRSSNYERLEGGMGPSKAGPGRRFAWKKFAIGAVVIIGLVYFFGPRKETFDEYIPSVISGSSGEDLEPPVVPAPAPEPTVTSIPMRPPHQDDTLPSARPTDPASDGDLTKTHYCTKPYTPDLPLVQFALMIDAGSTGSRIHIYKFNNCGPSPQYEYEVFKQRQPGLSFYEDSPSAAAQSLDELLDEALRVVPPSLQKCTPVQVKATAGLRKLGPQKSANIIAAVRAHIEQKYPFSLHGDDAVAVMDGRDEGVYSWITVNYLLDTIRSSSPKDAQPYAVLDLGGASTQIVFEPTFDMSKPDSTLEEGEHKYDLNFGGHKHVLYQHSYLGYGLMEARKSVHKVVEFMSSVLGKPHGKDATVANPCLAKGTERRVEVQDNRLGEKWNVTMVGQDVGSFEGCNRVVELVMAKDSVCEVKPCSFNGVYQPSLLETFPHGKVLLLSYFYDRLSPFVSATVNPVTPPIRISAFADLAKTVCEGPAAWRERWGADAALMKELEGRPEYCLDLTFMHALLRLGYEFSGDREVEIGKQIDGTELGWALGATISMVTGAELKCRV